MNNLNDVPTYNTKLKDKTLGIAGHQITQEILEGVLNTLESFADLQFKHVSTYAFSEIVRTPIENFFAVQQKPPMKTIFPKLQTLTIFPDESKSSSMISQENINNALKQLYFFHSELLTYAVNTVTDMLSIIKNKLDKLFPKEDIFKQMFDKWQTESSNMDNEKYKLPMIAEAVLNEISTKAKELKLHFTFRFVTS